MAVQVNVVGQWNGKDIDRATRQLQKLGKDAADAGRTGSSGLFKMSDSLKDLVKVGGIAAGAVWFKSAIDSAGELQDTVSAAGQVFGDQRDEVVKFGEQAATSMGLSENAAIKAATSFAVFAKSAGLGGTQAETFSTTLTQLAGDMASFYGGSVEDAVTAIGSALRGEQEPIRRYNILLDDATLRQEAMAMGLIKTTKDALTPQQKVLAANAAILKQSTVVQGDYNRTADQFSNVQRTALAEWQNTTTEIGQGFLPVATDAMQATRSLLSGFRDIPTPIKVAAAAMALGALTGNKLADAMGRINGSIKEQYRFRAIGDTWRYVGTQAAMAGVQYETTGQKLKAFAGQLRATGAASGLLKGAGTGLLSMLGGPWGIAIGGATLAVTAYMNAQQNAQAAVDGLTSTLDAQTGALTAQTMQQIADALKSDVNLEDWQRVPFAMQDVITAVADGGPELDKLRASLDAYIDTMGRASGDEAARAQQAAMGIRSSMENQLESVDGAREAWKAAAAATDAAKGAQQTAIPIIDRATAAANLQQQGIKRLADAFKELQGLLDKRAAYRNYLDTMGQIGEAVKKAKGSYTDATAKGREFQGFLDGAVSNLATYAQSFKNPRKQQEIMAEGLGNIAGKLRKMGMSQAEIDKVMAPFKQFAGEAKKAGGEISKGLALGIVGERAKAIAEAENLGKAAVQAVRYGAAVSSPSRYTKWVGNELANGLTAGVIEKAGGAKKVIHDATAEALSGAQDALAKFQDRGHEALDFIRGIRSQITDFGSVAGFQAADGATGPARARDITGQMRARVAQARKFAQEIKALRQMGLNNASLQEIIGAGPVAGEEIAAALLKGGKSAVGEVNTLERQLSSAAASLGDTAGMSQYGLNAKQAAGLARTSVTIEKGAVVVNVGRGTKASDAAAIRAEFDDAMDTLVDRVVRELESA